MKPCLISYSKIAWLNSRQEKCFFWLQDFLLTAKYLSANVRGLAVVHNLTVLQSGHSVKVRVWLALEIFHLNA
jgi:hypothetical protein